MKRLIIKPFDVLMFRSERPFTARESHIAKLGVISPLTFEGALKSKIFLEFCERKNYSPLDFQRRKNKGETKEEFERSLETLKKNILEKLEKDEDLKELLKAIGYSPLNYSSKFNVLGTFFFKKKERKEWFPIPNDIVIKDDEKENEKLLKLSSPKKKEERAKLKILGTEKYACFTIHSKIKEKKGLMSFEGLIEYLYEDKKPEKSEIVEYPYKPELRTGIKLEKQTKSTVEGHLYSAEFLRLKEGWEFSIWMDDKNGLVDKYLGNNELIRLGGEGKGAICSKIDEINLAEKINVPELIKEMNINRRFKLYLATPSHFGGYKPPNDILKGELRVDKLTLASALPGRPIYIGGYDFARNREKSLKRWVNAGAIYYYEFEGKIRGDLTLPIIKIDKNVDMRCAFVGRW